MRRSSVHRRFVQARVFANAVLLSVLLAALSAAVVFADGGGGPIPH